MKTILATTDFSDPSAAAVNYAASLSLATDHKMILYHAYSIPVMATDMPIAMSLPQEMEELSLKDLYMLSQKLKEDFPTLNIQYETSFNSDAAGIEEEAQLRHPDWIVLGLSDRRMLSRLLGSVATRLIADAKLPILLVPEQSRFNGYKKILFACDFSQDYPAPDLKPLIRLANIFHSQVELLYSIDPHEKKIPDMEYHPIVAKLKHERIELKIHFVHFDKLAADVDHYCRQQNMDLLVMAHHHHHFFEQFFNVSLTKNMVWHTHIPMLTLPENFKSNIL